MQHYDINQLIYGIVHTSSPRKQVIGGALAAHLSFIPGPGGKDGSVDGAILDAKGELIAHFQSKLSANLLPLNESKSLHSDLIRLKPKFCVYISGVGYEDSFLRLLSNQGISQTTTLHLLTLKDVIEMTDIYTNALRDIPKHAGGPIAWDRFLV